ncbi:ATP-binding protein [Sporomusa acidovorans]|uniref:Iron-sulfur cluster carrier protein n=1 Tax=Sporomusa acidovorans (strain ATCC 49682 / DSM 3132 / Mol) TaxID=1123286 RepID=A0ABZ3J0G6_SPOA4|nr:ATP-binding protein [Sporomusa acidovorans]OZC14440.1 electron transport complex subunit RsxB [Sporomusa acidovorans DSM 3132]SDF50415.1 MinD superfamily P-loop ATPase, contains an inserted ferredoxin domain [Sporomusa acidovorans]
MKELVIVSGKGGTGKTSISAALAYLAPQKVLVDCDVDAANFHLVSGATIKETQPFKAGFQPYIDADACNQCGKCTNLCRFGAITSGVITTPLNCEGCGVCAFNCPQHAIAMQEKEAGHWFVSTTRFGCLIHAELGLSLENSGKLVSKVRQEAKKIATAERLPLIITDGPPGIGCPAIAALSGASLALAVVEPSISGMHDLARLTELVAHFQLPIAVCINKSTLHQKNTEQMIDWCQRKDIPVFGQIPYSDTFRTAVQSGQTVLEVPQSDVKESLTALWQNIANHLNIPLVNNDSGSLWQKLNIFRK